MSSSDEETVSERSYPSERSGSLSPCPPAGSQGPPGDTLPWNLARHERSKRTSQDSVLDPAERAVVRVAGLLEQKLAVTEWSPGSEMSAARMERRDQEPAAGFGSTMAGYIPGLLPANHSQEKEFVQAYEDVLERYKDSSEGFCEGRGLDPDTAWSPSAGYTPRSSPLEGQLCCSGRWLLLVGAALLAPLLVVVSQRSCVSVRVLGTPGSVVITLGGCWEGLPVVITPALGLRNVRDISEVMRLSFTLCTDSSDRSLGVWNPASCSLFFFAGAGKQRRRLQAGSKSWDYQSRVAGQRALNTPAADSALHMTRRGERFIHSARARVERDVAQRLSL
ncbi:MACF1 factor, partial [Polyodon spathula]|nr:MACF1 factor [Polyodon spathula]